MRKIDCIHVVSPDIQVCLLNLNEALEKRGISEEDVISVQQVYYPCVSPSDRDPDKVDVYLYVFFWSD